MAIKFTNNASATLASSINSSVTSINLSSGQGAQFPSLSGSDYFYATLVDSSNNIEIVKVTARSTDTLTVVRGQDGTTGRAYSAGDRLELRVVAASLQELVAQAATATTSTIGPVQLNNNINSTSTTQAATPNAVKTAYDLANTANTTANAAMPKSGGAFTGNIVAPYVSTGGATAGFLFEDRGGSGSGTWIWYSTGGTARLYSGASTSDLFTFDSSGNITAVGNVTASSDERLKTNWRHLQANFVSKLANVKHGVYDRTDNGITQAGVSAQSLQEVLPEAVLTDEKGMLSVAYGNAALVAAIELAKKVTALEAEIAALKGNK